MAGNFNVLERAKLSRRMAVNAERIKRLEAFFRGQPLGTVRFSDAIITAAKILNLSASKITSGTLEVGQEIVVNDGEKDRILIMRDDIRMSKPGEDVKQEVTETTKKNFIFLSVTESHKILFADFITGGSYTHNLNKIPIFHAFEVDDINNPTIFTAVKGPRTTTTQITNLPNPAYLILFNEGETP